MPKSILNAGEEKMNKESILKKVSEWFDKNVQECDKFTIEIDSERIAVSERLSVCLLGH